MTAEKANILIVDDLPDKLLVLETVLAELGENIIPARSGEEALQQVLRNEFAVILMDVEMPDLDGLSALPLLFQKKRDLVVIMASTLTRRNAEISLKALSLGAADYVAKPQTSEGPVSASSSSPRTTTRSATAPPASGSRRSSIPPA